MRNGGAIRRFGSGSLLASVLVAGLGSGVVAGTAALPAAASTASSTACSCGEKRSDADQRQRADVVFEGTWEGSTSSASTDENGNVTESGLVHQFAPGKVHKGSVQDPQYVVELPDRPCDLGLAGPGPYLVFAERPSRVEQKTYSLGPDDLIAHPCGGTRALPPEETPAPVPAPEPAPTTEPEGTDDSVDPGSREGLTVNRLLGDVLGDLLSGLLDALGLGSDDARRA